MILCLFFFLGLKLFFFLAFFIVKVVSEFFNICLKFKNLIMFLFMLGWNFKFFL